MEDTPRRPGRPRTPVQRSELLALARRAFAAGGYSGTSMAELARVTGLRKASLFHHFDSKEALYVEAVGESLERLARLVTEAELGEAAWAERLDRLTELVTRYLGENPPVARLLLREVMDRGPLASGPTGELIDQVLQTVGAFVRHGMEAGEIPEGDEAGIAIGIVSLHLVWFAYPEQSGLLTGDDVFDPDAIEWRIGTLLPLVRRLCGI